MKTSTAFVIFETSTIIPSRGGRPSSSWVSSQAERENYPEPRHRAQAPKIAELCDRLSEINVLRFVDHVLVKCVGIGSLPLARSSCKNPPAPMAHDLLMFRFMITLALSVVMGEAMHYGPWFMIYLCLGS